MVFLKKFLINLAFLVGLGILLFIIAPDLMKQVFELYGALFGLIAIRFVIVVALPQKRRRRH